MRYLLLIILFIPSTYISHAQPSELKENIKTVIKAVKIKHDTSYIGTFPKNLTVKFTGSRNDIDYKLIDKHIGQTIKYKPNTPVNIGLGASYRGIGFTFGARTGLVKAYDKYGETKSFDLTTQIFLPKITFDIYGKYYRGYYISGPQTILANTGSEAYYVRPDLRGGLIGIDGEYVFNAKRFSFASTFSQKQFQKKSAGSFLLGAGIYIILINADSSIIPTNIKDSNFFEGDRFNKSNIYSFVVNGGYAYTFVIHKHYFVSGALNLGAGLSYTTLVNTLLDTRNDKLGTQLDVAFRIGAGYNSTRYFVGVQFVQLITKNVTPIASTREDFGLSSYRLTVARRFKFRQKHIDEALHKLTQ